MWNSNRLIAICALVLCIGVAGMTAITPDRREPLPVLGNVNMFELINLDDEVISTEALAGEVWLANFFFTSCRGICPTIMGEVKQVHTHFTDAPDLRFVSISVDPKRDTKKALTDYAGALQADLDRWYFLSGELALTNEIIANGFKLATADQPEAHSTRMVLVDRNGSIRGYYNGLEHGISKQIINDINRLLRES